MASICTNPECDYTKRHGVIQNAALEFCPNCGRRLQKVADVAAITPVSRGRRFGAYFIDFCIAFLLVLVGTIPIVGLIITPIIALYWLLRDINGASPGKSLLGLAIVSRGGGRSTTMQRILRNLPFAIMVLPLLIPYIGLTDYPIQLFVILVEALMVILTRERIGDKLAGTMVVSHDVAQAQYAPVSA
ncbi:RDD family protein [Paracidobacterium acidisoli]|uniref:RDD domain-containing protein n=1 Tax=Paracidobacterium acidisoli TaxID=2303751 RepID=A0A372IPR7_9BACT|nr:RDD family protein [Paracidobacterium acidisoli]MBT9331033.1 RDD family protein [Paracidobacterium acidisoli]